MQLKKLEDELGVQFFERTNKSVMVTPVGMDLALQARNILGEINTLKQIASHAKDPFSGEFRLGIIPTMGPYLLPQLLPIIKKRLPKIDLIVYENKTSLILNELRAGLLDAIILALPVSDEGLSTHELFEEPFFLAIPKDHRLVKKTKIHMQDIQNESLLLLEEGHCLRDQALEACSMIGATEKSGFKATSLETLRHLVASGAGITFLPEMAAQKGNSKVVLKSFAKPAPSRKVGMLWRKNGARVICCEKMLELFREYLP
jgi:LysR family hydrogen peroxide-inducible transcriptional activator